MKRVGNIIHGLGRSWHAAFWMFLIAYFAFHAFNGDNSIRTLKALQVQEQKLLATAADVRAEREFLEDKTSALSGKVIDPDVLEQQVRLRLGFTHPDEVIVLLN